MFREAADVIETKDGWGRITKVYSASCTKGKSDYVDTGNSDCNSENGIEGGEFAEWVQLDKLSPTRPEDPAKTATDAERVVAQSDDFSKHRSAFVKAANELITNGRCTSADFEEQGGWTKSMNEREAPVYFMYCGGMTISNKIYLNAGTGKID